MSDTSAIEWTDATWNPILGCSKVSAGCQNCYAIGEAWKKQHHPNEKIRAAYDGLVEKRPDGSLNWTGKVNFIPERLEIPLRWKTPKRIFVNSMSDLFHPGVLHDQIAAIFGVMAATPEHTYQVLTKRPERMQAWVTEEADRQWGGPATSLRWCIYQAIVRLQEGPLRARVEELLASEGVPDWPLPNVWLGTSVEDQRAADERIPHLLRTPAAVRFLSCEPLLGPVDLRNRAWHTSTPSHWQGVCPRWGTAHPPHTTNLVSLLDWVITGGESGPHHRPIDPEWARSLRDQCTAAGVPFFFKQWSGRTPKAHGRLLDGREWNEFPHAEPARALATV